jgi:hypothetical protein
MTKELSAFQRQILGQGPNFATFTQKEFDEALAFAKAEIMHVAVETTKQAIFIEREACADLAEAAGQKELAESIRNRIPSQRQ